MLFTDSWLYLSTMKFLFAPITFEELDHTRRTPPAFREGLGYLALARLAAVPWGRDVRYFAY
jgi:hypothetical protein